MDLLHKLRADVGFCYLPTSTSAIQVNFHMVLDDQGILQPPSSSSLPVLQASSLSSSSSSTGIWVVTISYDILSGLNERCIDKDDKIDDDDDRDVFPMLDIRSNLLTSQFNMDNVIVVEEYRCQIKSWINYCLGNLKKVNGRVKSFVCDHLLTSPEHAAVLHRMIIAIHSAEDNRSSKNSSNNQALTVSSNNNNNNSSKRSDSWLSSTVSLRPSKWRGSSSSSKAKSVISSPSTTTTSYQSTMKPSSVGASFAYAKVVKYSRTVLSDASYLRKRCEVVHEDDEEGDEDIDTNDNVNAIGGGGGIHKDKFTKTAEVMRIEVVKGYEDKSGVQILQVFLRVSGKNRKQPPTIHRVLERFRNFKRLHNDLHALSKELITTTATTTPATTTTRTATPTTAKAVITGKIPSQSSYMSLVKTPFPSMSINSYVGLSLSSRAVTERTAALSDWFRDVCYHYRDFPSPARLIVRTFLRFDMNDPKELLVYDHLAWGIIEMKRAGGVQAIDDEADSVIIVKSDGLYDLKGRHG